MLAFNSRHHWMLSFSELVARLHTLSHVFWYSPQGKPTFSVWPTCLWESNPCNAWQACSVYSGPVLSCYLSGQDKHHLPVFSVPNWIRDLLTSKRCVRSQECAPVLSIGPDGDWHACLMWKAPHGKDRELTLGRRCIPSSIYHFWQRVKETTSHIKSWARAQGCISTCLIIWPVTQ